MRLYYYSNLAGVVGWAASAGDFRKRYKLAGGYAVRVANCSVEAPTGYIKTGRGLANEPALKAARRCKVNLYGLGCAILANEMTGLDTPASA